MTGDGDGTSMPTTRPTPHTGVHRLSRRLLEAIQDVIVFALVLALFALMARTLLRLAGDIAGPELDFRVVVSEILFLLVMIELVRLLVVYLEEHHVAIDFMVEIGIVSTLREVVLHGVVELEWPQTLAIAAFLVALGLLLRFGDLRQRTPSRTTESEPAAHGPGSSAPN